MNTRHAEDELLVEVALGLRTEDDPQASHLLAHDPAARRRLARLRATVAELELAGGEARDVLRAAERLGAAPGEERVEQVLRDLVAAARPARVRLAWVGALATAAALVVLVAGLRWLGAPREAPAGPRLLGAASLTLERPGASFGERPVFAWTGPRAAGERFRVRVFDASDPLAFTPLAESPLLAEPRWQPPEARAGALPAEIRWTVERLGPGGDVREVAEAYARRAP